MDSSPQRRVFRLLEQQVIECGHRSSGTPGSRRLVRFLTTYLEDLGLPTEIEEYPIQTIRAHRSVVEVSGHSFRTLPYFGCPPFLNYPQHHDVCAPLECLSQEANARLKGKIALCEGAEQDWPSVLGHCQESGCIGVILVTRAESDDRILAPVSPFVMPGLDTVIPHLRVPVLGVSKAAGRRLREHAERGEKRDWMWLSRRNMPEPRTSARGRGG